MDVACGCDGFHMRPTGVDRGPDLRAATAGALPPSCSRAATRPWPASAVAVRCGLPALIADQSYAHLPPMRCAPSCSGAVARPWPAASMAALFDRRELVADMACTRLPPKRCAPSCTGAAARPWPATSMGVLCGPEVLVADLANAQLQPWRAVPSCSGAATRLWPATSLAVQCVVAGLTYTELWPDRTGPTCSWAAARLWAAALAVLCGLKLPIAGLATRGCRWSAARHPAQERRHGRGPWPAIATGGSARSPGVGRGPCCRKLRTSSRWRWAFTVYMPCMAASTGAADTLEEDCRVQPMGS